MYTVRDTIQTALSGYVENCSGEGSEETKEIQEAWDKTYDLLEKMPNGYISFYETFFEMVQGIVSELQDRNPKGIVGKIQHDQGHCGLYPLAEQYTVEFEKLHEGREWDGEFFEEIETFLETKLK